MSKGVVCSGNDEQIKVGGVWEEVGSGGLEPQIKTALWSLSSLMVLQHYLKKYGVSSIVDSIMWNSKF